MRWVFLDTRPTPPLIEWVSILIKRVWDRFGNFFKTWGGFGYCLVTSRPVPPHLTSIIYKLILGYLVKEVKITLIFANISHRLKSKTKLLIETKMPFFFFLSNTYNFSSFTSFTEWLFIFSKKILSSSSSTSLSSFGAQNGKLISSSASFTKRVLIFHHLLLFHYLHLMHKMKISSFLQKP